MPETINGQLAMTNNGGEQSSFSTPFIEEFDSNVNRYYQYFELVVVNSDPGNVNDIEFTVHFKNKDYTELDNVFDLGTSFIFKPVDPDRFVFTVKYTNGENSSNTSFGYTGTEHISNNHVTVISFLMYPEKIGYRPGIQYDRIFDEDCEELLVFIDGVNTRASENFYLPFSILKNLAIGLDCNNPNISFQWNFDNTRFIYPDLAYQCYMELPVQNITSYKYFPLTRLNFKDEFITEEDGNYFYKDIHNFRVLTYFNYTDNGEKVFRFEAILNSIDKDAIAEDSDYLFETSYDSLNLFRIILAPVNKNHNYYYNDTYKDNEIEYDDAGLLDDRKGIQFSCSTDASMANVGLGMRNIGGANMTSISTSYNNKPLIYSLIYYPDREQYFGTVLEYNGESIIETSKEVSEYTTPNFIPYMNNIIIQHTKYADVDINLGTKPFIVHFTKSDETKNDLYVSPYNTYWKSLFPYTRMQFLNNHYQFSSPLLDNLLVLPYDLSNQNNNMYVEIKFYYENQSTINVPFALIGSGLKLSDSTLEDSQESQYDLSTFTGIVLRSPIGNKALLNAYIYKNGAISQTLWEDLNFSFDSESPVVAFKYLNGDDYFRIITTDTQNYVEVKVYKDITDMEILDALKYVVIGQEINNTNGIYRPIGINFGPDNLHFEDEVQDLWDQDQYDKEFNMDIITSGSVDYEQGELSDDNGDRDIDGTLLVEALRPEDNQDIADDYIINGIIEGYISEFNILSGSMNPNRFELTIGTNDEQLSINETIHIDTELDFISTLFKNQDDTFTGTATVTIEYSSGSGFNITGTTVTATYTGKDDNTLHFDMPFNIQAPPNDITPGENHFGITIILDDGVNDPVSYTIGDITVIVKAINYYKQNKAQLHQFISLSGGGGIEPKPTYSKPIIPTMSIQNTGANYCKLDITEIPESGYLYIPIFELGKCTVTVEGGNELKSNCYCLIPNDSDELKGTNFDPSMLNNPPEDILSMLEIDTNKVETENGNIRDGEFTCCVYYFGFDGNLDSSIGGQILLNNFYGLFYLLLKSFEGQKQGLISFTFNPIRFNLYYYDEYGNPQETYFDYTPKLYIDLNINTLDPVMVVTRSYPDYIDIEKSNTERDFNLYIDFTVSYENDVNSIGTSKIVNIGNKQILGSIDFTFKGTGKVDNLNPILNTQGITQCTMSIDWDNTDITKIRCNFVGKYLNNGGTYSVQTILGSVFISDIEDGTYDTGNIYLVFMLK